jgi:hypothetical protein
MHKLPTVRESLWVEQNDAALGWSELEVTNDRLKVPYYIIEDLSCVPESEELLSLEFTPLYQTFPRDKLDTIQRLRRECHNACYWYEEAVEQGIPTAPGVLLQLPPVSVFTLKAYLARFPFVRHCAASPKDIVERCVFRDPFAALQALHSSPRTRDELVGHHLFLREERNFEWEARCFWSRDRLTAVSCAELEIRPQVEAWFAEFGPRIPYHQAVVDIGFARQTECVELVEFNSFGPDMPATAGNFSWAEDMQQLVFGKTPVFRAAQQ